MIAFLATTGRIVEATCERCGASFGARASDRKVGKGRFCSAICARRGQPLHVRFWRFVDKTGDCWLWTGTRTEDGYGRTGASEKSSSPLYAHRVSWELANGPIPDGLFVLHRCDNPPCVRPDHLFLGTTKDNADDAQAKGRLGYQRHPDRYTRLTADDVRAIRNARLAGEPAKSIAARFGISESHVYNIANRYERTDVD